MQLSVVILNYNVSHFLRLCLQSVLQATENLEAEIIVIDNNSADDSCEMLKTHFPDITLIENEKNIGFAKANNQGVALAKGEYICILNPDTVVPESLFEEVLIKASSISNLGILGIKLVNGKGVFLPESKRNIPTPRVSLFKFLGNQFSKYAPYYADVILPEGEGEVEVLVGAFMLVKKEIYEQVGGFDEDYFMYGEDIDLSYKVLEAGYSNYYYGSQTLIHFKGESTLKDKVYQKRFFGAMRLFYKKHFKSHFFMNLIVYFGIWFASLFMKASKKNEQVDFEEILLISENEQTAVLLEKKLKQTIKSSISIVHLEQASISLPTLCILDMQLISCDYALQLLKKYASSRIKFRFIPKNASFAVGSDTSLGRGEVIFFN